MIRLLAAWLVVLLLAPGFHHEMGAYELAPASEAESLGSNERELSWEEREFERVMRLREIHAGRRALVYPSAILPIPAHVLPPALHHPPLFCSNPFSRGCFSGSRIIIERRNKADRNRK